MMGVSDIVVDVDFMGFIFEIDIIYLLRNENLVDYRNLGDCNEWSVVNDGGPIRGPQCVFGHLQSRERVFVSLCLWASPVPVQSVAISSAMSSPDSSPSETSGHLQYQGTSSPSEFSDHHGARRILNFVKGMFFFSHKPICQIRGMQESGGF
jgi:hypothetical protein